MTKKIDRPLDLLGDSRGKEVLIQTKGNNKYSGILLAFDIHINLVVDSLKDITEDQEKQLGLTFLRGDTIISISPAQ